MADHIILRQESKPHPYIFDRLWGRDGGTLFGNNFFTELCAQDARSDLLRSSCSFAGDEQLQKIKCVNDIYIIPADLNDPDFMLLLWKHGRGEPITPFIDQTQVLFLYEWMRINGFPMLLPAIVARDQAGMCVVV